MDDMERHEMKLETTHPTGAEEWYCPTCGRRFLMQWSPQNKRIILDAGDETATHTGGKGGLEIGSVHATPNDTDDGPDNDLGFWSEGLQGMDFDL